MVIISAIFKFMRSKSKLSILKSVKYASLLVAIVVLQLSTVTILFGNQKASASGGKYYLHYPDEAAIKRSLADSFDKDKDFRNQVRTNTSIYVTDESFFGGEPVRLTYSIQNNEQISVRDKGDPDRNELALWSKSYFCSKNSGKVSFSEPSGTEPFYRITYGVGLEISDADEFFKTNTHTDVYNGVSRIVLITPAQPSKGPQDPGTKRNEEEKKRVGAGGGSNRSPLEELADNIDRIENNKCRPTPVGHQKIQVKNFYGSDVSAAERRKINDTFAANPPGAGADPDDPSGPGGAGGDSTEVDCNTEGVSLGWIICPFVEFGADFTDSVFENIIAPMLESTPVSGDTEDPFYKAWQGFRFLANVLLIGSLLAIVYAQAKGGD